MKTIKSTSESEIKPFLRWAGGKTWLIKHIKHSLMGVSFKNYHEPFLGGASLYLFVRPPGDVYLSDLNEELIETYKVVKNDVERLISEMRSYKNTESFYYSIRDKKSRSTVKNAARFIYLNQTGDSAQRDH